MSSPIESVAGLRTALFAVPLCLVLASALAEEAGRQTPPKPAAEEPEAAATTPPHPLPPPVTTSHVLNFSGRSLKFKATAGAIRLSDAQSGEPQADVAVTAFLLEGADPAKRPIAFVVNGGPGASSAWLDLGALGPWRLALSDEPHSPSAAPIPVDNADTWLDFADLVFIDPPGTGYSRILAKGDGARRRFYSVEGDIETLAVVIRKWLGAAKRLESPKFIVGESYGGFRAPKLARRLQDVEGVGVSGLVMISPVIDLGWFESANSPLPAVGRLPSQAAAGRGLTLANGKELAEVEDYAAGPYLVDLLRGERDSAAQARIVENVARLTGLDPAFVRRLGGRVDVGSFAREPGRAAGRISSHYDATVSGYDPFPHSAQGERPDPILEADKTSLAGAMADVTAARLGWPVDARYEILNENVYRQWDWGGGREKAQALGDLTQALAIDPNFRVLIAHGLTDQMTPYFASKLLIAQIPQFGDSNRIELKLYAGGHMLYFRDASRAALREDARRMIEGK